MQQPRRASTHTGNAHPTHAAQASKQGAAAVAASHGAFTDACRLYFAYQLTQRLGAVCQAAQEGDSEAVIHLLHTHAHTKDIKSTVRTEKIGTL